MVRSSGARLARVLLVWSLVGLAACAAKSSAGVELTVTVASGAQAPSSLRFDWLDGGNYRLRDVRVPADGELNGIADPLAKIRIEVVAGARGRRRAVVRGLAGDQIISEGAVTVDVDDASWVTGSLVLAAGRLPDGDGDGVPDAVDLCPGDQSTFGACAGGDAGAPADAGPPLADAAFDGGADQALDVAPADLPADLSTTETSPACTALLVVGFANVAGDKAMAMRLAADGCPATIIDDKALAPADATGKSLAIVSETAVASQVKDKLKAATIGVVIMQPMLLDDYALTGRAQATDWDMGAMETMVDVVLPAHPLAGNLTGTRAIFTDVAAVGWGATDQPMAIKVASYPAAPTRFFVFAFDKGATMSSATVAPGRRVAFLATRDAITKLNADGWTLFDATVRWAGGLD